MLHWSAFAADDSAGVLQELGMGGLWRISPEERDFQFKLIFGGCFLLLATGVGLISLGVGQYALFGETARALVVDVDHNDYDSRGRRLPYPRIEYQYLDEQANVVRTGNLYPYDSQGPGPGLGETFMVRYLPNHDHSAIRLNQDSWQLLLTLPASVVFFALVGLCLRKLLSNDS